MSEECCSPAYADQISDIFCTPDRERLLTHSVFGVREALLKSSSHKHEEILTQQKESLLIVMQVICIVFPQQKSKELAKLTIVIMQETFILHLAARKNGAQRSDVV